MTTFASLFLILILTFETVTCIPFISNANYACEPKKNLWTKYSGFRIQREFSWAPSSLLKNSDPRAINHKMIITECSMGQVVGERHVSVEPYKDIVWNMTVCDKTCLRLARRAPYTTRDLALYFPNQLVGALFACGDSDSDWKSCEAELPLLADRLYSQWTQRSLSSSSSSNNELVVRIPILYTPDVLDRQYPVGKSWQNNVNPAEIYNNYKHPYAIVSLWEMVLQENDYGHMSKILAAYTPLKVVRMVRYWQALLDQW